MYETITKERALLVIIHHENKTEEWPIQEQKEEFVNLVVSTGIEVADTITVRLKKISPSHYIGKGKIFEILDKVQGENINVVIFNDNLTFTQQRNLEEILQVKTIDRTQLILDIFARHAHTQEGSMQVELAQLEYLLPRLKGKGIILSRLGGGIGTRGPGEKKLEVERRRIFDRIVKLKKDLLHLKQQRDIQRKKRFKENLFTCSLVGYTNAGKTTLFNRLTEDNQKTSNSLFTTLDPLSRTVVLSNHIKIIISDTVGFIYKLPPPLMEAFKATLEELQYADLLLHIVDASSKNYERLISTVEGILKELNLKDKHSILVFNKIDKIDTITYQHLTNQYPEALFVSALNSINLDSLIETIKEYSMSDFQKVILKLSFAQMELLDYLYKHSEVIKVEYQPENIIVLANIKRLLIDYLRNKSVVISEI